MRGIIVGSIIDRDCRMIWFNNTLPNVEAINSTGADTMVEHLDIQIDRLLGTTMSVACRSTSAHINLSACYMAVRR